MNSTELCGICSLCSPLLFTLQELLRTKGGTAVVCTVGCLKLGRMLLHISDVCFRLVEDKVKQAGKVRGRSYC